MFFGKKAAELRTINRAISETARKRSERIEELEQQVAQLQRAMTGREAAPPAIETESKTLLLAIDEAKKFEAAAAERAHTINKMNLELTAVREAATNYSLWGQALDRLLIEIGTREIERKAAWRKSIEPMGIEFRER